MERGRDGGWRLRISNPLGWVDPIGGHQLPTSIPPPQPTDPICQ